MLRQIGLAVGVAVLIAVLGTPHSPAQTLTAYQRASWVIAAISLAGGSGSCCSPGLAAATKLASRSQWRSAAQASSSAPAESPLPSATNPSSSLVGDARRLEQRAAPDV